MKVTNYDDEQSEFIFDTSFYAKIIILHFDELFKHISLSLTGRHSLRSFFDSMISYQKGYEVDRQNAPIVKINMSN